MPDAVFDQSCDTGVSRAETNRALVPLTLAAKSATAPSPAIRPDARFVVQLIANATQLPQTGALHRTAPEDAATTYSDVSVRGELSVPANGLELSLVA
jgi:hypothetical protein